MKKFILLGAPGAGKGTISNYLIKHFDYSHLSTGDMFREAINNPNDPLGTEIKNIIAKGELVSDDLTNSLVSSNIRKIASENIPGFILDGYPRTLGQAEFLETITDITAVIYLMVDEKVLINRLTGRRLCPKCNAIYNINTDMKPLKEGICDKCGTALIQRKDDNLETVELRINEYNHKTKPLIEFYKEKGLLKTIQADASLGVIYSEINKIISE